MADTATLLDARPASACLANAALQQGPWNTARRLSRGLAGLEQFLAGTQYERAAWLSVAFGAGIVSWFALADRNSWYVCLATAATLICGLWACRGKFLPYPHIFRALVSVVCLFSLGFGLVWIRSGVSGAVPIEGPVVRQLAGNVLSVQPQPAEKRVQLLVATRLNRGGRALKVRINVPLTPQSGAAATNPKSSPWIHAGDLIEVRARLLPPAQPALPGAYNFARTAWFAGIAATGSAIGPVRIVGRAGAAAPRMDRAMGNRIDQARNALVGHILTRLPQEPAGIAAALVSGDVGAITRSDAQAMRDAGLAHLLAISGLHVGAVMAASYLFVLRGLALFPWLALRWRLPLVAACAAAIAGISYTVLTGNQVPTVRSCLGALLVLMALACGRETVSLRILALVALCIMALWPETVMGPSFEMSFAAVLALVSLSCAQPVRRFLAPRDEGPFMRVLRSIALLLLTGVVIELALMPIGLFHFHRAGVYGALANVIAIPLTTMVIMPCVAVALMLDTLGGLGVPVWWLAEMAIRCLLAIAHWVADRPGAVTLLPTFGGGAFAVFALGGLWLALLHGKLRLLGLVPAAGASLYLCSLSVPDVLVSDRGRQIAIVMQGGEHLLLLRNSRSGYARENIKEMSGFRGTPDLVESWPGARCNPEFCRVDLARGKRIWKLLLARNDQYVAISDLNAACAMADIVIADRRLPRTCRPRWLLLDRPALRKTGGVALYLDPMRMDTVAASQGEHGWWRLSR